MYCLSLLNCAEHHQEWIEHPQWGEKEEEKNNNEIFAQFSVYIYI